MLKKLIILSLCLLSVSCANQQFLTEKDMHDSSAARYTDSNAAYKTGMHYMLGRGVEQNYGKALTWFERAADQGNPYAESQIAYLYAAGKGVPKNYETSLEWYQKAARHGLASAQYNLGLMYANGLGTPVNKAAAQHWFQQSASRGFDPARRALMSH